MTQDTTSVGTGGGRRRGRRRRGRGRGQASQEAAISASAPAEQSALPAARTAAAPPSPARGPRERPSRPQRSDLPKNSRPVLANADIYEAERRQAPATPAWSGPWRNVVAYAPDMFFGSKIAETGKRLGYRVHFIREVERMAEKLRELKPDLVIVDAAGDQAFWTNLIRAARETDGGVYPVIAFGSHRDLEARAAALEAGAADFIANSRFFPEMPKVFEKYVRLPSAHELAARPGEVGGPEAEVAGAWIGGRFRRGPIVPEVPESPEEPESFVTLARRHGTRRPDFNPNPDPGGRD